MVLIKLWFSIFILGIVFYPLTSTVLKKFCDKGWIFSKIIGIAITSWTVWFLSYIRVLEYSETSCYIVISFYAIVNLGILFYKLKKKGFKIKNLKLDKEHIKNYIKNIDYKLLRNILIFELIFIACFCLFGYFRSFNQEINNYTEHFMNYGFINECYNTKYMPPNDIWYSGGTINYYYYGHYTTSYLCKISNLNTSEGYNCMAVFLFTCTFILPLSIGYNLFKIKSEKKNNKLNKILPAIVAVFIAIATSLGGSLHYPIHKWIDQDKDSYSYVKEARYIGEEEDSKDKLATDVPAYSSILGDLHAHYIDLFFSLTTIALLSQYFLDKRENKYKRISFYVLIALLGFLLGIQKMTNFWEFPIYLVIIAGIIIVKDLICGKFNFNNVLSTALVLLGIVLVEELITLPFSRDLMISSTTVLFTGTVSPFNKMLVKWGLPTLCIIAFLIAYLIRFKKSKSKFKEYLNNNLQDLFMIIIGVCALGLVILPEIVYLKDIYGDAYKRFNTAYKLTYQGYLLFSICTSYFLFKFMLSKNRIISYISLGILFVYITTFGYGINAIFETTKNKESKPISAEAAEEFIKNSLPDDYEAIKWIRQNIDRDSIILESSKIGTSYTINCRMSTFTGNPTVLGWSTHEWLWRCGKDYGIPKDVTERSDDIAKLYNSTNISTAQDIINKYNIDYIYIGKLEYDNFPKLNAKLLTSLGKIVYNKDSTYLIKTGN